MRIKLKKLMTLGITLSILGGALSGCSSGTSKEEGEDNMVGAMENYKAGETFKATESLTFPIMYSDAPHYPYNKDWLLFKEIEKRTNVKLDCTIIPTSDYEQKRSLLISSGDAPLIIPKTYQGQEVPFVSSGAILPISEYLEYMPNFQEKVKKWDIQSELDNLRQSDGKFYVLPGLHENVWPDYTLAIRTDIFEQNNIEIPKTWEDVYEASKKLKEIYPDTTPLSDRYQGKNLLNIAAASFGTKAGWGNTNNLAYDKDKDEFYLSAASEEYKEFLTFFNKMVTEGLLDKESFTQEDDQAIQKFVTGNSFMISTNSQEIVTYRTKMNETLGEGAYSIKKITVPGGPKGDVIVGTKLENGIMFSSQAAKSENFVAMLQFIDWLYYSDEGREFAKWGVEGETYTKEDGVRTLMDNINYTGLNPNGDVDLRVEYGFSGGVFSYGGSTELLHSMMSEEELEFQEDMLSTKTVIEQDPPAPLSEEDQERSGMLNTQLKDLVEQNTLKFIIGTRSLDEFDKFVKELEEKGSTEYIEMYNKAYKEFEEK